MMTLQALSDMTLGAAKMVRTDPHGWTLAAVSIIVVFGALLILYILYSAIGQICIAGLARKKDSDDEGPRKAAAAAIALYLEEEEADHFHIGSTERIITITPGISAWGGAQRNFRKYTGR